jgi:hypothetical protein
MRGNLMDTIVAKLNGSMFDAWAWQSLTPDASSELPSPDDRADTRSVNLRDGFTKWTQTVTNLFRILALLATLQHCAQRIDNSKNRPQC